MLTMGEVLCISSHLTLKLLIFSCADGCFWAMGTQERKKKFIRPPRHRKRFVLPFSRPTRLPPPSPHTPRRARMTTPTTPAARRLAVYDIHAEPDVTVVVDVPCFEALPRELPHIYLAPADSEGLKQSSTRTTSHHVGAGAAAEDAAADDDDDDDVTYVNWESVHESMQRAYFLNNTLLARDPVASRLIISKMDDACTSMDGAVWDATRFFVDRLDGQYEEALRSTRLLRSSEPLRDDERDEVEDSGHDGRDANPAAGAAAGVGAGAESVAFEPTHLCWRVLARVLVAKVQSATAGAATTAERGREQRKRQRDGEPESSSRFPHFAQSREGFAVMGAFYDEIGAAIRPRDPGLKVESSRSSPPHVDEKKQKERMFSDGTRNATAEVEMEVEDEEVEVDDIVSSPGRGGNVAGFFCSSRVRRTHPPTLKHVWHGMV